MQTGLMAFEIVARINQVDVDLRAVVREYGIAEKELTEEELLRIAKNFGFKAKIKSIPLDKIFPAYPLPAIIIFNDNILTPKPQTPKSESRGFGVLLRVNNQEKKVLVIIPGQTRPMEMGFEELANILGVRERQEKNIFRTTKSESRIPTFIILAHKMITSQIRFGFKWFYNEILQYKSVIIEVLLGSFVVQLFGLITPLFTQVILDKVLVHRSMTTLEVLAVAFIAITIFELLLNISRNYIFTHTAYKIDAKLGAKLFKHLFSLPFVYFETRKVGNIVARVRELDNIREFITNKSVSVIIDLFFSFVFVVVMLLYSVNLTLIAIGFVSVIAILYLIITPELRKRLENKFQMAAQTNSYLVESISGVQTVKSLAIEGSMQKNWEDNLGKYVRSGFKLSNMANISGAITGTLQRLMTITILFIGVKLVIENKLTVGQLIAFQMLAGQFAGPVLRLVNLWNEFQQALLSVDRLGDILNHPTEIHSSKAITLPKLQGSIRLENVCFKYTANSPYVVDKISFHIKPGMSLGIIGRSGSGKSTLTKLIQRLYLINEGAIYIDDIDVRHINPIWLRNNIGVVLQENYLFSGTIRENIALPRPDAPIELIIEASKIAGAHEFISQFPEGYETIVGERGSTLSGGQKQRIAIARALITNPRLLIFDEATSSLDIESERIIQTNLHKIKNGRTMIIVSHKLSIVKDCDLIIAIERGRIVEMGGHSELMAKKGYYYTLLIQQNGVREKKERADFPTPNPEIQTPRSN